MLRHCFHEEDKSAWLRYREAHMISQCVAQGHVNREKLEILEATRLKPSRRRRKGNTNWFAHSSKISLDQ